MMLALISLVSVFYMAGTAVVGGIVGWLKGRSKRKRELEEQIKNYSPITMVEILKRQQEHEDDLNGVVVNEETGQTAEQVAFGIFPNTPEFPPTDILSDIHENNDISKEEEKDNYEKNDRFEILDLRI